MHPQSKQIVDMVLNTNRMIYEGSKCGISPLSALQLRTVLFIKQTGKTNMKDLAQYFGVTAPTATVMIDHLEREKLIKRLPDKNDRRITLIHITAKGEKRAAQAMDQIREKMDAVMAKLDAKEKAQLIKLLKKIFA